MKISQQVLMALLKKSLFNIDISLPSEVDWQDVFQEAVSQSVAPIAYDGTAGVEGLPKDVLKKFKDYSLAVFLQNDGVLKGQAELTKLLEDNFVAYAILKGTSVAKSYPKPELRTLGDVDILVNKQDFESTKKLLCDNGYLLTEDEHNHFHCAFKKRDVSFELHFEMSDFPETQVAKELQKELEKATTCVSKIKCSGLSFFGLDSLYQAASLLLHTERHLAKDGIGLRQLSDFGFFIKQNPDFLQVEENIEFLKKFGLYKLAIVCMDLFDKYFCDKEIDNPTADALFEMALEKGNFGTKRDFEQTYSHGAARIEEKNALVKYYRFFEHRAELTWKLAKKYPFFRKFGFIYLPIRHAFRIVFRKSDRISYRKIFSSTNELNSLYNDLSLFKR